MAAHGLHMPSLLKSVDFPEDGDPTYVLAVSGPSNRQVAIRKGGKETRIAAAIEIQRLWRGYRTRFKLKNLLSRLKQRKRWTRESAAKAIGSTWRSYCDRKIFKYYRDLINFHQKGDPMSLLRSINPLEAKLLDKASGAVVRFRLGGASFPPTIYYKIFTNGIVVDICSFSPRPYSSIYDKDSNYDDASNWYKREENNGWRPIEYCRLYPGSVSTARPVAFHYSKCQRQEDVIKKRKQRKIEWFKKLYMEGKDTSGEDDNIEELLEWSYHLDFERYISDWKSIGSSDPNKN